MKKKIVIVIAVILAGLLCFNFFPKRPFSNLQREDIESVERKFGELYVDRLSEEEIDALVEDLKEIEIGSVVIELGNESGGDTALGNGMYTIRYTDGKEDVITCIETRFIKNSMSFVCNSEANTRIAEEYYSNYIQ